MELKEIIMSLLLFISGCMAGRPQMPDISIPMAIEKNKSGNANVVVIDMQEKKITGRWYNLGDHATEITISPIEDFSVGSSIDYILKDNSNPEELSFVIKGNRERQKKLYKTITDYLQSK